MWEMLLSCISLERIFFLKWGMIKAFIETFLEGRNKMLFFSESSPLLLLCWPVQILWAPLGWWSGDAAALEPYEQLEWKFTQSSPAFGDLWARGLCLQDCFCGRQSVATREGVVEIQCDPWLKIRACLAQHLQNFCCFRCAGSARITFYRWGFAAAAEFRFEYCPTDPTGSLKFGGCEMLPTRGKFGCSFLFNTAEHHHSKSTGFSKASCDAECSFWPSLWDCSTKSSPFLLSPTQPEIKAPKPTAGFVNSLNAADLWLP